MNRLADYILVALSILWPPLILCMALALLVMLSGCKSPNAQPVATVTDQEAATTARMFALPRITRTNTFTGPPRPGRTNALLEWDASVDTPGTFRTEVWATTNFQTWQFKTNVAGTNRVWLPITKAFEFYIIRNAGTNGKFSDWCRKTTL